MTRLRILLWLPICSAFLFVAIHLLLTQGEVSRIRFVFGTGFLLGLLVVPETVSQVFPNPRIIQLPAGFLAGTLLSAYFHASPYLWIVGGLIGGVLGWTARYWGRFPFHTGARF